jgi:hypothetical protein
MMKHINDIEIQNYIAGKLTASGIQQVQEHLAICKECSDRWRNTVEVWDALGQWDVDTAGRDLTERIIARAQQEGQDSIKQNNIHKLWKEFLPAVLRVAASIVIAVGVGHKLGKYSVTGHTPKAVVSQNRPEYLSALGLEWSSELAWFILEDNTANMEKEQ